jgi:DNA-binding XRE family transcriptional regulator
MPYSTLGERWRELLESPPPELRGPKDRDARERVVRFGTVFKAARERAGISQRELARRSGVPQSSISRVERGLAGRFSLERLTMVAAAMGNAFPLGLCPHEDHRCVWKVDGITQTPYATLALTDRIDHRTL